MMKKIEKKAQEEIVGFVLIMVIVAIVFLVFLGIFIRKGMSGATETNDAGDLTQYLTSLMQYTSDCAIAFEPDFSSVSELASSCYMNELCANKNVGACEVLKSSVSGMLNSSLEMLNIGEGRPYTGYIFNISYYENSSSGEIRKEVLSESYGNCSLKFRGAMEYPIPTDRGDIIASFKVCS